MTNSADPVENGTALLDTLTAAAMPYVGRDVCKLPATLTVTLTGVRSDPNNGLDEQLSAALDAAAAAGADLVAQLLSGAARLGLLGGILALILVGVLYLFREPAGALIRSTPAGRMMR